jgi:insertion element IS1 protein InsB
VECPRCHSQRIIKNGRIHTGKQKWMCKDCKRQFVLDPQWRRVSAETKKLIDKLLLEDISLAGIARVAGVSEPWLQAYVNTKNATVPRTVQANTKKKALDHGGE